MLWFALVSFCSSALNNVFVTYMFSSFMRTQCSSAGQVRSPALPENTPLSPLWFLASQGLFAVWNAVNDPLAGWLSDTLLCGRAAAASPLHRRAWVVRWGGLCWCLFFALAWFPPSAAWGSLLPSHPWLPACLTGLHFLLSICCYDSALTLVEVNHSALLSELQPTGADLARLPPTAPQGTPQHQLLLQEALHRRRVRANTWVAAAMAVGAVTSLPAHWAWEADCLPPHTTATTAVAPPHWWWPGYFRAFALGLAAACAVLFWWAADGLLAEQEGWRGEGGGSSSSGGAGRRAGRKDSSAQVLLEEGSSSGAGNGTGEGLTGDASSSSSLRHRAAVGLAAQRPASTVLVQDGQQAASGSGSSAGGAAALPCPPPLLPPLPLPVAEGTEVAIAVHSAAPHPTPLAQPSSLAAAGAAGAAAGAAGSPPSYRTFLAHLLALPSLRAYVAIATLQAFDCSFAKSFYTLFLATLWGQASGALAAPRHSALQTQDQSSLSSGTQAMLVCASFLLPHALTLVVEPTVVALGIRQVLRGVVYFRACLALAAGLAAVAAVASVGYLAALLQGTASAPAPAPAPASSSSSSSTSTPWLLLMAAILYQLLTRVTSETVCRNLSLLKAAVVDDFRAATAAGAQGGAEGEGLGREQDRPAALVGAADFFPRIASSAAPMLGYVLLQWGGVLGTSAGLPSNSLILFSLVAVPGAVSAVQTALLSGGVGGGRGGAKNRT